MRQAGRYLKEYREIKKSYSFLQMCRSSDIAAEVTMQPLDIFDVDAAIVFADILLPLEGMGFEIDFNPGPLVGNAISHPQDIENLRSDAGAAIRFVPEAIEKIKRSLSVTNKSVIGFGGAPFTMACYAINQGGYKHFAKTIIFAKEHPAAYSQFLDKISDVTIEYLNAQLQAGADVVQLFDSWAGNLSTEDYKKYALPYVQKIVSSLNDKAPLIYYAGNSGHLLSLTASSGAQCLSLDWRVNLSDARKSLKKDIAIQGNFDPSDLFLSEQKVKEKTRQMLLKAESKTRYIANLGHGVLIHTPRESVRAFVDEVKNFQW